ncbi:MAG: hypothetical protein ACEQSL_00685 [Sediminibacterium sp.]
MSASTIIDTVNNIGIAGNAQALVTFKDESSFREKTPIVEDFNGRKFAYWGTDNQFPQGVIKDYRKVTELSSGIRFLQNSLVNAGLVYGETIIENGAEKFIRGYDKEIEDWNRKTNLTRYIREATWEFYMFWNVYTRVRASNDRSKIASLDVQESAWSRLGVQDQKTGKIDKLYVSANWNNGIDETDKSVIEYNVIDPYYDAAGTFARDKSLREFIYPTTGSDSGYTYYATAPWNSVRESAWLEVAKAIPLFKKALLEKQYTIKYHFEVSDKYLLFLYPNYMSMTDAEKDTTKTAVLDMLDKKFKGSEKAGANILSLSQTNPATGEMYPGLIITAVDDKIKDGIYIEDSQEAAMHVYNALGIDATLANTLPGRGNFGGSGSDKRVAYNIHIANSKPEQDIILEPVDFAYEVNGFKKKFTKGIFTLMFKTYWLATLDQAKQPIPEPQQQAK